MICAGGRDIGANGQQMLMSNGAGSPASVPLAPSSHARLVASSLSVGPIPAAGQCMHPSQSVATASRAEGQRRDEGQARVAWRGVAWRGVAWRGVRDVQWDARTAPEVRDAAYTHLATLDARGTGCASEGQVARPPVPYRYP